MKLGKVFQITTLILLTISLMTTCDVIDLIAASGINETQQVADEPEITYPALIPKTGQTTSYATGDDGDLEKGVAWPNPRFTDNGDGTITDNLTGLMWDQTGNRFGGRTWAQALSDANSLSLAGHSDWRLPHCKELLSLFNYSQAPIATWLNGQGFSNIQANNYWSSATEKGNTILPRRKAGSPREISVRELIREICMKGTVKDGRWC